jgi:hypothetical protein
MTHDPELAKRLARKKKMQDPANEEEAARIKQQSEDPAWQDAQVTKRREAEAKADVP